MAQFIVTATSDFVLTFSLPPGYPYQSFELQWSNYVGDRTLGRILDYSKPERTDEDGTRWFRDVLTLAENATALGLVRNPKLKGRPIDGLGRVGDWQEFEANNPPPGKCTLFVSSNSIGGTAYIEPPADTPDIQGYLMWVGPPGFDPASRAPDYDTTANLIPLDFTDFTQHEVVSAAYDRFGKTGLVYSDRQTVQKQDIAVDVDIEAINTRLDAAKAEVLAAVDEKNANVQAAALNAANGALAGVVSSVGVVANDVVAERTAREVAVTALGESTTAQIESVKATSDANAATLESVQEDIVGHGDNLTAHTASIKQNADNIEAETLRTNQLVASTRSDLQTSITETAEVAANANSATNTLVTNLTGKVNLNTAAIQTESQTRVSERDAMGTRIDGISTKVDKATTDISSEVTARTNADSALGTRIDNMVTRVGEAEGKITTVQTAVSDGRFASATSVTTLDSKVNGYDSRITTAQQVAAGADGKVKNIYGVTQDVNGYATGWSSENNGSSSAFKVRADKFEVASPSGGDGLTFTGSEGIKIVKNGVLRIHLGFRP